eukprot:CAMPEP_0182431034 /NCGR_PEP_ID=MMETSP1167-20130531/45832_1 /TAXON_ID=2988 /ORGANISM="Mallomonas Sp, Strain CCMP3275" /LENGTH=272 /DNA_ID=CAMNT_0024616883 /DNA_START=265 /DNA_END=1083 /DNA_ORIENTATION=-
MVDVSNGTFYPVSYWTEKGGRPYQEDRVACLPGKMEIDSSLYAVYDGHGGAKAAQFCKDKLLKYVVEDICFQEDSSRALTNAFHRTENEFLEIARRFNLMDGSTAVVSLIHNRKVTVANAGDSRCIIVQRHGKVKAMSIDHKPCREDEEKRIRALGGRVVFWGRWRVEGVLAVSRAIGDLSLKPYVSCDPELITKTLDEDDLYMVLASDGLWDVMRNEEVSKFVLSCPDFASMGRDLCHEATLIGSTDNITVLVIDLKKRAVSASVVSSTKN